MGIFSKSIKYGTVFVAAKSALNAYNRHEQRQHTANNQDQQQIDAPRNASCWQDHSGYVHQPYCNGHCEKHCSNLSIRAPAEPVNHQSEPPGYRSQSQESGLEFVPQSEKAVSQALKA